MATFEYMEVDLHGDAGTRDEPDIGQGQAGFIEKINAFAKTGWRLIWLDRDTNVHVLAILEREVPDAPVAVVPPTEPEPPAPIVEPAPVEAAAPMEGGADG